MAKKQIRTYRIDSESPEDQLFIRKLLAIYGYVEREPGVFAEQPVVLQKKAAPTKRSVRP